MSLPQYPEYKQGGVEWLGMMPGHWEAATLKRHVRLVTDRATSRRRAIALENVEGWTGRLIETEGEYEGDGVAFEPGDILFGKLRPYLAKVLVADFSGEAVGDFHVLRPGRTLIPSFIQYQMLQSAFISVVDGSTFGSKMPRASWEALGEMLVVVPPTDEQVAIVSFLDRETAKIDALIAEQEKLLALLAEKRQATITRAVTRGVDPNVPLKDSGIPWLGEVPAHWEVLNLKNVVVLQRGHDLPADARQDGDVPVVSSGGYIGFHSEARASGPGIVTGRYGSIGSFVYVEDDYWPLNTALYSVALHGNDARYVWYMLQSVAEHFVLNSMKSAVPGVDRNDLHTVSVVRAPNAEQKAIVSELDALLESLDGLSRQCESGIQLLEERRSALIAAAVTGQIDVRGVMESQAA